MVEKSTWCFKSPFSGLESTHSWYLVKIYHMPSSLLVQMILRWLNRRQCLVSGAFISAGVLDEVQNSRAHTKLDGNLCSGGKQGTENKRKIAELCRCQFKPVVVEAPLRKLHLGKTGRRIETETWGDTDVGEESSWWERQRVEKLCVRVLGQEQPVPWAEFEGQDRNAAHAAVTWAAEQLLPEIMPWCCECDTHREGDGQPWMFWARLKGTADW